MTHLITENRELDIKDEAEADLTIEKQENSEKELELFIDKELVDEGGASEKKDPSHSEDAAEMFIVSKDASFPYSNVV